MATRNTATLPASNDFKPAGNAEQCLILLGNKLFRLGRFAEHSGEQQLPEVLCEAILTQVRNQLDDLLTELDLWRAL